MDTREHLYAIVGRCTGTAWGALKALQDTPHFFEVVSALANKPGTILVCDIERALAEVMRTKSSSQQTCDR